MTIDGRRYAAESPLLVKERDGLFVLRAGQPGLVRHAPPRGAVLRPGMLLGELEVLGVLHRLVVPEGVEGRVVEAHADTKHARKAAAFGDVLAVVDPRVGGPSDTATAAATTHAAGTVGKVFRAPLGGRYYGRPSPTAEPFVKVGDTVRAGQTVALIEVMKTFNRTTYAGAGLPEEARVKRFLVSEGDDVSTGDALFELE